MSSQSKVETTAAKIILRYLNSQLIENYNTATDWFDLYGKDSDDTEYDIERSMCSSLSPCTLTNKYILVNLYAWIRYHHRLRGANGGDTLEFGFSEPKLTFICDHDALLRIGIKSLSRISQDGSQT